MAVLGVHIPIQESGTPLSLQQLVASGRPSKTPIKRNCNNTTFYAEVVGRSYRILKSH